VSVGFVFGQGSFQAIDRNRRRLAEVTLGPAHGSDFSTAFSLTRKSILVLDLRAVPAKGPLHDWFAAPHPRRDVGSMFTTERDMTVVGVVPDLFDAVVFVDKTTRARPLHP
jgi:erythromycin esterase